MFGLGSTSTPMRCAVGGKARRRASSRPKPLPIERASAGGGGRSERTRVTRGVLRARQHPERTVGVCVRIGNGGGGGVVVDGTSSKLELVAESSIMKLCVCQCYQPALHTSMRNRSIIVVYFPQRRNEELDSDNVVV